MLIKHVVKACGVLIEKVLKWPKAVWALVKAIG